MESNAVKGIDAPIGGADWLLQNLVSLAKRAASLDVTLQTSGGIVSGSIVSGERYIEPLAERSRAAVHDDDGGMYEAIAKYFEDFAEVVKADDEDSDGPYFIHLANATIATGSGQTPLSKGVLWRGKLSDVAGFSFGRLS